jgi:hypothetical protein
MVRSPPESSLATGRDRSARRRAGTRIARFTARCRLVFEILEAYFRTRRTLAAAPLATALARLRAVPRARASPPSDPLAEARRLAGAVERTLALVPGDTRCLTRSLVLTRVLARRGIPVRLVISARSDSGFLAHAWVEHDGRPLLAPGPNALHRLVEL